MDHIDTIIFYKNEDNINVAMFSNPACGLSLEQVALKDVPHGRPFKYVARADIPEAYWDFQAAFEVDYSNPDGYGANYGIGSDINVVAIHEGNVILETDEYTPQLSIIEHPPEDQTGATT